MKKEPEKFDLFDNISDWMARLHNDEMMTIIPEAIKRNDSDDEVISDIINCLVRIVSMLIVSHSDGMAQRSNTMNAVDLLLKYNSDSNTVKKSVLNNDFDSAIH